MAYNEYVADRIRQFLNEKKAPFYEKKMMGGVCFMVDDKMCCGTHFDKKRETDLIMARIGEVASMEASNRKGCLPMDFTGRPMKGFVFIGPEGFDLDEDLEYWLQLCLDFNPFAKKSKKRK
ncbi:RNA methyltransferase [Leptobacterium flavescens]|uniref:RNA methyltransferase n=1 Tax=Leptobacterium flavescens TaxID=472055 RepID=A0A6P0UKD2_9FLAO|nr:TfoX/Sxy family protein [Leptobacterium flavescens]NER13012.1 RNA methyltransferase [Leptobacterium flavescens]